MRHHTDTHPGALSQQKHSRWRARLICAGMLWIVAAGTHAATIYRCTDGAGRVAFQDNPCAVQAQQHAIDLNPQPLIGDADARMQAATPQPRHRAAVRARPRRTRTQHTKPASAWECRAADGEVFYRFARCPGSVPGDGVVRDDYMQTLLRAHTRGRHNAWSRIHVHGVKVTRAEACQRIHAVAASSRDGYLRDAKVSTYDHLLGRGPCDRD